MEKLARHDNSEAYNTFSEIIGPDSQFAAVYYGSLAAEAESLPAYALVSTLGDAYNSAKHAHYDDEYQEIMTQIAQLEMHLHQFDDNELVAAWNVYGNLQDFNESQKINIYNESAVGQYVMGLIHRQADGSVDAPYANYVSNTDEAWSYVPREAAETYLSQRSFGSTHEAFNARIGYTISISSRNKDSLEVPSRVVTHAQGFTSWLGRANGTGPKYMSSKYGGTRTDTSFDTIRHYAGLPTELPPVNSMTLYIQPNGNVVADNNSGDSHRLAAALLRGDEFIKTKHVSVRLTSKNI